MRQYPFVTLDVFTDRRFGGNQLAVFPAAAGLSDAEMQALAAEMNYSETTFVLPPRDSANTARVRIFNRTAEMPFAGHPNVGTGFALAALGRADGDVLRFEEMAGLVVVRVARDADGAPAGAEIDAPQPLQLLGELPAALIAGCIGLPVAAVRTHAHPPIRATVGVEFVLVEVDATAIAGAAPDLTAFRRALPDDPDPAARLSVLLYARDGSDIRARMFAPLAGTWEDPATGSANATLAALLLSLGDDEAASFTVTQGVEMGRPSRLTASAHRAADGIRARVAGGAVMVLSGTATLD
jgi:trans-2,3-dihydro-3-hydroxyanthranilate isomerase